MGSQHNEHKLSRRGFLPFTKMNFICDLLCDLLPRNWLPTIFALEADPNVVPSSRQSGIGRCRSNLEWRELGNWNRTSSTLVRRSRAVGLVAGTCSSERHDAYSAAKLVADSVVQLVQQQLLLRGGSWEGSAVTLGILAVNSLRRYAATSVRIPCSGICSACGRTRRPPESPRGSDRLRPGRGPRRARRLERGQREWGAPRGFVTDGCGRRSATSRPSTTPSPPSTRCAHVQSRTRRDWLLRRVKD